MMEIRKLGPGIMWQAEGLCPVHTRNDRQRSCQLIKQVGCFSRVDSLFPQTLNLKFVVICQEKLNSTKEEAQNINCSMIL